MLTSSVCPSRPVSRGHLRLGAIVALGGLLGCDAGSQLGSQARVEVATGYVDASLRRGHVPTEEEMTTTFRDHHVTDGWDRPIVYRRWVTADRVEHWALIALGRDGEPDCPDIDCYLHMEPSHVSGDLDADIVVIDGAFIREAGK